VVVGRDSASGTREFFWEHVMEKEDFVATMLEKNSNGAVHQTVSQTEGAIGFVGLGYVDNEIKALKIGGVQANVANVVSGDYPIARNLNMFTLGTATGIAEEFLKYIDSDEGQQIVEDEGFVPKDGIGSYTTVEELSGSIKIVGSTTVLPIAEKAAEEFNKLYSEVTVTVTGGGSSVGVQSAGEETADIGMASRELKSTEEENYPDLVQHVVCSDGIAIIVHPSNDYVDDLTVEQVKAIYKGTYTNWNEL
jgi:phosphate transport system substrate-binding protein